MAVVVTGTVNFFAVAELTMTEDVGFFFSFRRYKRNDRFINQRRAGGVVIVHDGSGGRGKHSGSSDRTTGLGGFSVLTFLSISEFLF